MADERALQDLIDRAAISDVLITYAAAVDTRDWALFRSLFAEELFLDFSSFNPELYRKMSVDELVEITRKVAAFDATQHLSTNHRHTLNGDRAACVSYMQAGHFMTREGQQHVCFLYGHYTYELRRTAGGWKIDRYGLQVTASQGDPRVFEWAGLR
jgi:hypothetical protein